MTRSFMAIPSYADSHAWRQPHMAKVMPKIVAVFYELVGARIYRTMHDGRNVASVFRGLLESMLFRTFVPGKWHFR